VKLFLEGLLGMANFRDVSMVFVFIVLSKIGQILAVSVITSMPRTL